VEKGDHVTFECLRITKERRELPRGKTTWEELDLPDWRKEGDDDPNDAIKSFFNLSTISFEFLTNHLPVALTVFTLPFSYVDDSVPYSVHFRAGEPD